MVKPQKRKNIAVAMSGGIDSSVAAFLLQKKCKIFGITMFFGSFHNQAARKSSNYLSKIKKFLTI